ncbi:CheR family methyltransferase [Heyndrickxia coagulans]|uniref:CheR family methyltransferase n=1 Tax=Heyndrickxia coagulans TaxID=1398 RepID=UPI000628795C|nr:protein-glutamate O-methyltransferase CheR [Heyndrickxia coagulans]
MKTELDDYGRFIAQVKKKTGIDLSLYKEAQMKRRLTTLYEKRGFSSFSEFFHGLDKNEHLLEEFLDRMTINVSEFYRNKSRWDVLERNILPGLLKEKGEKLKIWSAASSTGEEPYTMAMILSKYLPLNKIQILATDIDQKALQKAEAGVYSERSILEVPREMKQKYFQKSSGGPFYQIADEIRRAVIFKQHNLLHDPYPAADLIICRNVLIYFTEEAKVSVYRNFSKTLSANGILFVGSTEQIFNPAAYGFEIVDTFFYRKI